MQLQQRQDANKWFLRQQIKQMRNKIKIGIFTAMFLMQYFCLIRHASVFQIIPWNWKHLTNLKVQEKKVFWHLIVICATHCVSFSSKSKAINVFLKHILKSKTRNQSIQARKKLFCHVIVKNYLCNVSRKFLIKIESMWGAKSKSRHPSWLYSTVVGLSEATTRGVV